MNCYFESLKFDVAIGVEKLKCQSKLVHLSLSSGKQLQENTFTGVGKAFSALPSDYSVLAMAAKTVDNYQNARVVDKEEGGRKGIYCMTFFLRSLLQASGISNKSKRIYYSGGR